MMTCVIVTIRAIAFHFWPEAPLTHAYLSNSHRHLFYFRAEWSVDTDRAVEFHTAQQWLSDAIESWRSGQKLNFGRLPCEQIAREIRARLILAEHPEPSAVEVWEDQENGARVEFS